MDSPQKIVAFATHRDEQLVHVPDVGETTLSPPQNPGIRWVIAEAECCRGDRRSRESRKANFPRRTAWVVAVAEMKKRESW